jgi:DeoR/GlpR family transcriptional regulator of sugar metabolism
MDLESRHRAIISAVEVQGTVRVVELAKQLNVTEMTIRRDLSLLERQGLLKRVHGGGISARGRSYEPTLVLRNTVHVAEKQRIARLADELIKEGDFIALDVGSTTFELARRLASRRNLTVITPSLLIANVLANLPELRLILPGGIVRPGETSMVGELSHRALEMFHVDRLFLGVGSIDSTAGLTEYNWDDTLVKQAMLKTAKQVIALADASKFERIATVKIAPLEALDVLVTDQAPPAGLAKALQKAEVKVLVAPL